jgi:general nucleoside transport system permease protein
MKRPLLYALAAPLVAVGGALGVSALVLWFAGYNPFDIFEQMWTHVDSTEKVVSITNKAVPYYIAGIAVALGFRMNLFNIGVDGQYRLAALLAAAAGAAVTFPAVIHVPFVILVATAVGAAWAAIPGVLKVTRGVNEVVATIMLNFIAVGVTAYLLGTHLYDAVVLERTQIAQTETLPASARFPHLDAILPFDLPEGSHLHGFLVVAIIVGVVVHVVLNRTRFGLGLRASGANPATARSSGVSPNRMILTTIIASGAIAGLAAMAPLMSERFNYSDTFPLGVGLTGISVALLGQNHPAGVAVAAFAWAGVEEGARGIVNGPPEITKIMLGTLLLTAVIGFTVTRRKAESAAVRDAAAQASLTSARSAATTAAAAGVSTP